MAKRLNYEVGFTGDTSQLKASLNDAVKALQKLGTSSTTQMTQGMREASKSALELANNLKTATNQETGKLDLVTFNRNLANSKMTISDYAKQLSQLGPTGQQAFMKVAQAVTSAELPMRRTNKVLDELWTTMKNTARWQLTSSALHGFMGALNTCVGYSKALDKSLNSIRIVTGQSAEQMADFAVQANNAAKNLSTTTTDYTDAALIYYQQGLSGQDVTDRTDITIKMANAANESAQIVSDQLTAVWNNFYDGSQSLEHYADAMVALGAATASSSDEIAGGLEKFASIADMIGLSFDYAASALATITATTRQSEDVVGTALKTIFARIQGLNLGETLEDGTDLNKYSEALDKVGISIKDSNGELRNMDAILDDMGAKWGSLAKDQQVALAQTVAGVRQYNQLVSLMDNWDFFEDNLKVAQNSEGELNKQADIYAESWEAARKRVKAAAEDIYDSILNPDSIIAIDDVLTPFLSGIAQVVDALGGLKGIALVVGSVLTSVYSGKLVNGLQNFATNIQIMTGLQGKLTRSLQEQTVTEAENLDIIIGGNRALEAEISLMREKVQLQGMINKYTKNYDQTQMSQVNQQVGIIDALRQQVIASAQKQTSLLGNMEEYKTTILLDIEPKPGWEDKFKRRIQQFNSNVSNSTKINIDIPYVFKNGQAFTDVNATVEKITVNMQKFASQAASIDAVRRAYANLNIDQKEASNVLQELIQKTGLWKEEMQNWSTPKLQDFIERLGIQSGEATRGLQVLKQALMDLGGNPEAINQFIVSMKELAVSELDVTEKTRLMEEKIRQFTQALQTGSIQSESGWAKTIVNASNHLMNFGMTLSAVSNMGKVFQESMEGNITAGEAFIQIMTNLGMILMSGSSLFMALSKSMGALVSVYTGVNTSVAALTFITKLNIAAEEGNIAAKIANVAITKLLTVSEGSLAAAMGITIGVLALFAAGIVAAVKIIDALIVTQKEASQAITDATQNYTDQKSKLDELNSSLEETRQKIEELESKDSLSLVEQDELSNLKEQEASLERQANLRERIVKAKQAEMAYTIADNFDKKYDKTYKVEPKGKTGADTSNYKTQEDLDKWFNGLSSDQQAKALDQYQNWTQQIAEATAEMTSEVGEDLAELEQDYANYLGAIDSGAITANPSVVADMQDKLEELRKLMYPTDNQYYEMVIRPVLDGDAFDEVRDKIFRALSSGDIKAAGLALTDEMRSAIEAAGISIDDLFNEISERMSAAREIIKSEMNGTEEQLNQLTAEDWDIILTLDLENISSMKELMEAIENAKNTEVKVSVDTSELDEAKAKIENLNTNEEPLEEALMSYKEQGYLTMDQTYELIKANEEYAKYIKKVGDEYVLTTQSLTDFTEMEKAEKLALDQAIEAMQNKGKVDRDYAQQYVDLYSELIESSKNWTDQERADSGEDFDKNTEALKRQAQAFQEGKISASEYFDAINQRVTETGDNFAQLSDGIDNLKELDYAKTMISSTSALADGFKDLISEVEAGGINMQEYYAGAVKSTKTLMNITAKSNKYITKTSDGYKVVTDSIDDATKATEEYKDAQKKVQNLNTWEKQVDQAEGFKKAIDDITSYYDYFKNYLNDNNWLELPDNFDTTTTKFKNMCDTMAADIWSLKDTNAEAFSAIMAHMEAENAGFDSSLITSQSQLASAMQGNTAIASSAINGLAAESQISIGTLCQIGGQLLQSLADAISSFNYTIQATGVVDNAGGVGLGGGLVDKIGALVSGEKIPFEWDMPSAHIDLTGSGSGGSPMFSTTGSARAQKVNGPGKSNYIRSKDIGAASKGETSGLVENLSKLGAALEEYGQQSVLSNGLNAFAPSTGTGTLNPSSISTDNNRPSGSGSGGKGKGGGGGSGSDDSPEIEDLEIFDDRYHDINNRLEEQSQLLDKIDTAKDRAFGVKKLEKYKEKIEAINKEQELYKEKLKEAEKYLNEDLTDLQENFSGVKLNIDSDSKALLNYEDLEKWAIEEYNKVVNQYNALGSKSAQEAFKDTLDAAKKTLDLRQDILAQYESDQKQRIELLENIAEDARKKFDEQLNSINAVVEVRLKIKDFKDTNREIGKNVVEAFGDAINWGTKPGEIDFFGMQDNLAKAEDLEEHMNQIFNLMSEADDSADFESVIDSLEDLHGNIADTVSDLKDWLENLREYLTNVIDTAAERFAQFTDQLDHNGTVLDSVKELLDLQGITYKTGKNFELLQKTVQGRLETATSTAKLQKQWMEKAAEQLAEAEKALAGVTEEDAAYDTLKNNRDALLEQFNESQEAMLDAAKEAMETAREYYTNAIEKAAYDFEQAISGGMGLDLLQQKYDNLISKEERYLDKVNETYEVSKWNRQLQKAIDEETNEASKNRLKTLQKEIEVRREGNKLSKYDLDILEAKYQMTLAQNALEEAQNAKSSVRLVRNESGNWDYQFTADQSKIDEATQKYEDAANNYYNIAKDQVKNMMDEILQLKQDTLDQIKEVYEDESLTEEERGEKIAEIRRNANDKILYIQQEYQVALEDMTDAGGEIITEYGNTYNDVMKIMELGTSDFTAYFEAALDEMENAADNYNNTMEEVTETTGSNVDALKEIIDDTTKSTQDLTTAGTQAADAVWKKIEEVRQASEQWSNYAACVRQALDVLYEMSNFVTTRTVSASVGDMKGYNSNIDYSSVMNDYLSQGGQVGDEIFKSLEYQRYLKILGENFEQGKQYLYSNEDYYNKQDDPEFQKWLKDNGGTGKYEDYIKSHTIGYATGGYTGTFDNENGKLAFLHEKELVLNQEDTDNILSAVSAVRTLGPNLFKQIERILDNNIMAGQNLLNARMASSTTISSDGQVIEQIVHIQADFPGVSSAAEIEAALNNIVNDAAQYASIRK
jgi:TP901 family phage tail tape measure protein